MNNNTEDYFKIAYKKKSRVLLTLAHAHGIDDNKNNSKLIQWLKLLKYQISCQSKRLWKKEVREKLTKIKTGWVSKSKRISVPFVLLLITPKPLGSQSIYIAKL